MEKLSTQLKDVVDREAATNLTRVITHLTAMCRHTHSPYTHQMAVLVRAVTPLNLVNLLVEIVQDKVIYCFSILHMRYTL